MDRLSNSVIKKMRDGMIVVLIILVTLTVLVFWYAGKEKDNFHLFLKHATDLRIESDNLSHDMREAILSRKEDDFKGLNQAGSQINYQVNVLRNGLVDNGMQVFPPSPDAIKGNELTQFSNNWESLRPGIQLVLAKKDLILQINNQADQLVSLLSDTQDIYWSVIKGTNGIIDSNKVVLISKQIDNIDTLMEGVSQYFRDAKDNMDFRRKFVENMDSFSSNATLIYDANSQSQYKDAMDQIKENVNSIMQITNFISEQDSFIQDSRQAVMQVTTGAAVLSNLAKNLQDVYISYPKNNRFYDYMSYILAALSFLSVSLLVYLFHSENMGHLMITERKNKRMQVEIDKLIKQLPDIATGKVSLDQLNKSNQLLFEGSLPQSFVYAIGTLKKLVFNIGQTAYGVSNAATDAQKITKDLAVSSNSQAQEISEVTLSVNSMAQSIQQVSGNAATSTAVAQESVSIAAEGGKVVRSTISGMERIQTQIQETSNYMRRLSDSSQEIGEIVSLIDGIADQTNILSLNASIQAAMAGEAGRGFAVVADEVQRLAEKVSYATKEIGSLVRSIQTDTNQVIVAMDQTKAQVLEGVNYAQDAGATLEKIETVSRRLSDLVQNISSSASEQVTVSSKISRIMNDVKDIAKQTASGTMTTVDLIGKLMQFVTDLHNSVLDFNQADEHSHPSE